MFRRLIVITLEYQRFDFCYELKKCWPCKTSQVSSHLQTVSKSLPTRPNSLATGPTWLSGPLGVIRKLQLLLKNKLSYPYGIVSIVG